MLTYFNYWLFKVKYNLLFSILPVTILWSIYDVKPKIAFNNLFYKYWLVLFSEACD